MTWCKLCNDIYNRGGSVESFLEHFNRDHAGKTLSTFAKFHVHQCYICQKVTKSKRGLSRHIRSKHGERSVPLLSAILPPPTFYVLRIHRLPKKCEVTLCTARHEKWVIELTSEGSFCSCGYPKCQHIKFIFATVLQHGTIPHIYDSICPVCFGSSSSGNTYTCPKCQTLTHKACCVIYIRHTNPHAPCRNCH